MDLKTNSAMANPRASCGPVEGFARPSFDFRCSGSRHTTRPGYAFSQPA